MTLATIPVDRIDTGRRLREINDAQVNALIDSIADVGLLNPITVYPRKVIVAGIAEDGYGLVAGAHRLEAVRSLGLTDIDAQIVDLSELQRQIAECDENLCGSRLTPADVALFTNRRKEAYEALHGKGKAIGARAANVVMGRSDANAKFAFAFTADTAAKTGGSERKIQLDADRGAKINMAALAMVRGTALDTGIYLDKLKSVKPENQCEKVKRDLEAANKPKPKAAPHAPDPDDDYSVRERQVAALMNAWNKAGKEAREAFLDRIGQ